MLITWIAEVAYKVVTKQFIFVVSNKIIYLMLIRIESKFRPSNVKSILFSGQSMPCYMYDPYIPSK